MVVIRPIESKVMDGGGWWPTRPLGSHRPCCDRLCDEMLDGFLPVRARSSHSGNRLGKKNKISKRKFLEANSQINSQRSDDYLANVFFQEKGARHRSWLNDWRIFIYFLNCSYTPCMDTKIATCVFLFFFFYLILFGRVWRRRRYSRARPLNQVFSLWCNFFSNLKTKKICRSPSEPVFFSLLI